MIWHLAELHHIADGQQKSILYKSENNSIELLKVFRMYFKFKGLDK